MTAIPLIFNAVNRSVLFIGYEPSMREEIAEYLKGHCEEAIFTDNIEETLKEINAGNIETVILNMQRLEDAAILRYINIHFKKTRVVLMPGPNLREVIPALSSGHYDLIEGPFKLDMLQKLIDTQQ
jgi:DNA-binding NtrC family response regulator